MHFIQEVMKACTPLPRDVTKIHLGTCRYRLMETSVGKSQVHRITRGRGRAVFPNNPGPMIVRTRESQVGEFTLDIPICPC